MNIIVFQGIFLPLISYDDFIQCADSFLKYIDQYTLEKYRQNSALTFYDQAQLIHAINLSKFQTLNIETTYFTGFSLGIYSALAASKILGFKESFDLIQQRAIILDSAVQEEWDIYSCIGLTIDEIECFVKKHTNKVYISTISSNKHTTLSLDKEYADDLVYELEVMGAIFVEKYLGNAAWHTKVIYKKNHELKELFRNVKEQKASNIIFSQNHQVPLLREALINDCYFNVDFRNVINFCQDNTLNVFLVDETTNLEKIFFTNTRNREYKVIKCVQ